MGFHESYICVYILKKKTTVTKIKTNPDSFLEQKTVTSFFFFFVIYFFRTEEALQKKENNIIMEFHGLKNKEQIHENVEREKKNKRSRKFPSLVYIFFFFVNGGEEEIRFVWQQKKMNSKAEISGVSRDFSVYQKKKPSFLREKQGKEGGSE
ncbi:hypothetical protein ACOSQ2_013085 [Xanthoceras sorbifolium]